eukprot:532997-Prymnesium_polylepis.1
MHVKAILLAIAAFGSGVGALSLHAAPRAHMRSRAVLMMAAEDDPIGSPVIKAINALQEAIQTSPAAKFKAGLAKLQAGDYDEVATKAELNGLINVSDAQSNAASRARCHRTAGRELSRPHIARAGQQGGHHHAQSRVRPKARTRVQPSAASSLTTLGSCRARAAGPFCIKAKQVLDGYGAQYRVVECAAARDCGDIRPTHSITTLTGPRVPRCAAG